LTAFESHSRKVSPKSSRPDGPRRGSGIASIDRIAPAEIGDRALLPQRRRHASSFDAHRGWILIDERNEIAPSAIVERFAEPNECANTLKAAGYEPDQSGSDPAPKGRRYDFCGG
jgi:hypothetical protein